MPATKVKAYLDTKGVKYVSILHSPAFTAPEIAASAHVSGRDFAKTVIVMIEDEMAMVVLPLTGLAEVFGRCARASRSLAVVALAASFERKLE